MNENQKARSLELYCLCPECNRELVFQQGEYRYTRATCPSCKQSFVPYEYCTERQSNREGTELRDSIADLDPESAFAREMLTRAGTLPVDGELRRRWLLLEAMFKAKTRQYKLSEQQEKQGIKQEARRFLEPLKKKWDLPDNIYELYVDQCLEEEKLLYLTEFINVVPQLADKHPEQAQSILEFLIKKAIE